MSEGAKIKQQIFRKLQQLTDQRIETARIAIHSVKESRDNETKSSAGDKHETGRAMMQLEMERNNVQLTTALELKNEIDKINIDKECHKVEYGSLVFTNQENYFLSVGLGKIEIKEDIFYAVSPGSPIGKILKDKKIGNTFTFLEKEIEILNIL